MLDFLKYTLEAGIIFAVLMAIYNGVYAGTSYNKWERGYILASTAISYLLPLMKLEYIEDPRPHRPYDFLVEIVSRNPVDVVTLSHERTVRSSLDGFLQSQIFENIVAVLFAIYLAGVAVKLISYINGIRRTLGLRTPDPEILDGGIRMYRTQLNTVAFSFFGNIFLGRRVVELTDSELDTVVRHEKNHIKGLHSMDTLILGFYSVLQWMNPMVRLAQRQSRLVCENIADRDSCNGDGVTEYSRLILRLGIHKPGALAPGEKSSGDMLRRITQLLNADSERLRRIRFISSIPMLAILISAYIVLAGAANPKSTGLPVPVEGRYRISAGFFENQKIMGPDGVLYNASHRQVDLAVVPDARILAPVGGHISSIDSAMVTISSGDLLISLGGIAPLSAEIGDSVSVRQVLGHALGSCPMYIKVANKSRIMNPELVFDL